MTLYDLHDALAWFLVLGNAAVGVWALAAQYVPVLRVRPMWWAIGVAQLSWDPAKLPQGIGVNAFRGTWP
jgi:hypothetical protein